MTKIIIFGTSADITKVKSLIQDDSISIVSSTSSRYQQERNFINGDALYGHAVGIICISEETPLPFSLLSPDIIKKQLPLVLFIKNNPKSQLLFEQYTQFLEDTHSKIFGNYKINSFYLQQANCILVREQASERNTSSELLEAIEDTYSKYNNHPPESRTVRTGSIIPTDSQLMEKKALFTRKGTGKAVDSIDSLRKQIKASLPTVAFFGVASNPHSEACSWGAELKNVNFIYGLMGRVAEKPLEQQSMMYQFAWHAAQSGCRMLGVIPYEQTVYEENRDFSELNMRAFFVAEDFEALMKVFTEYTNLIVVGSCGTGTYEQALNSLRMNPERPMVIINDDESNTPLVHFLNQHQQLYTNVTEVKDRESFKEYMSRFAEDYTSRIPATALTKEEAGEYFRCWYMS